MLPHTTPSISRRVALAGLGAGALGLVLATRGLTAAAQEATPAAMSGHPAVGSWQWTNYPGYPDEDNSFAILNADGIYIDVGAGRAIGVGEWRATGERTVDLVSISTTELVPLDAFFGAGHVAIPADLFPPGDRALWRFTMDIDETGNHFTSTGSAEIQDASGNIITTFPYVGYGDRMTLATGSDATPAAE
jgi:hypothetical protein